VSIRVNNGIDYNRGPWLILKIVGPDGDGAEERLSVGGARRIADELTMAVRAVENRAAAQGWHRIEDKRGICQVCRRPVLDNDPDDWHRGSLTGSPA
jgi:hypothetical protein